VIWSLKGTSTFYPTTYIENFVVNDHPCFFQGIIGERSAIRLSANSQQYLTIAYLFDFRNISFSVSAWIYLNSSLSEMTIFSQCDSYNISGCLFLRITNMTMQFGFYSSDTYGNATLQINYWHHVAFVYDYTSQTQIVYLDGVDNGRGNPRIYLGDPSNITIGRGLQTAGTYFDGLIDRISILDRAMTADEVLEEATLSAYYSFHNSTTKDSGPNEIDGYSYNVNETSGFLSQAILFTSMPNRSYFQAKSFLLLGVSQYSYSFSFWINPAQTHTSGSIIHISSENGWCLPMLGFSANGSIIAQSSDGNIQEIIGPQPPADTWTHIALTYEYGDQLKFYQNGSLIGNTNQFNYTINESPVTLTLGFSESQTNCINSSIVPAYYLGLIEEVRIYSRCLTAIDIQTIMQLFSN
jgi:hypothetical protein